MLKLILTLLFALAIIIPVESLAQPSKSYKKQQKVRDKADKSSTDFVEKQKGNAEVLKKFQDQLTALDKAKLDARASGDMDKVEKIETKIRQVKGQMFISKDKIEQDIIKEYSKKQEKEVRKRMKRSKKKANRVNKNKKNPFLAKFKKKRK